MKFTALLTLGLTVVFAASNGYSDYNRTDVEIARLAERIREVSFRLNGKFDYLYAGTPQYRTLKGCVNNLQTAANQVAAIAGGGPYAARSLRGQVDNMSGEVARIHGFLDRADSQGYRSRNRNDAVHIELGNMERLLDSLSYHVNLRIRQQNEAARYGHWNPQSNYNARPNHQRPSYDNRPQYRPQAKPDRRPTTSNQFDRDTPRPPHPREVFESLFGGLPFR